MLAGEGASEVEPVWTDRTGAPMPHENLPDPTLPAGKPSFAGQPPERRRLLRHLIRPAEPGRIALVNRAGGDELLVLEPEIVYPRFLFALNEELRESFAPGGIRNFVETGTLFGHTTLHASYWFERILTIELSHELHAQATAHLAHRPNVRCLHGNSGDVLPGLIGELEGASLFFLDAHWSGDDSVNWDESRFSGYPVATARFTATDLPETERQVPLMAELEAIALGHSGRAAVLIDDWGSLGQRDHGFVGEDWSALERDRITGWFETHPRTLLHRRQDDKRYLWLLEGIDEEGA